MITLNFVLASSIRGRKFASQITSADGQAPIVMRSQPGVNGTNIV